MKKLLTLTFCLLVLTTFTGLSAAQEWKTAAEPAAVPYTDMITLSAKDSAPEQDQERKAGPKADMITLSATPNVQSLKGCAVTVWPQYSGDKALIYKEQVFTLNPANAVLNPTQPDQPPNQWKTDQTGIRKFTIKSGAKVTATMQGPKGPVTSTFVCPAKNPTNP